MAWPTHQFKDDNKYVSNKIDKKDKNNTNNSSINATANKSTNKRKAAQT